MTPLFKCVFTLALLLFFSIPSFAQVDVGFDGGEGVVLRVRVHPARYTFFFEQYDELELGPNREFIKLLVLPKSINFYDNPELKGEPIATIDKYSIKLGGEVVYSSKKYFRHCKGCYYRSFPGPWSDGKEAEVPYLNVHAGDIRGGFVQYIYADEFKNGVAKVSKFTKEYSLDNIVDIPLKRDFYFRPSDVSKFYYTPPGEVLRDRFLSKHPVISNIYQSLKKCTDKKDLECFKKECNLELRDESSYGDSKLDQTNLYPKILELFHINNSAPIKYDFYTGVEEEKNYEKLFARVVLPRMSTIRMLISRRGEVKHCYILFGDDYKLPEVKLDKK
ncbi:hypothetical protein BIY24_09505 [Halobacteriovorax marinus]|uniref:hypothetical protein n=1 Tax=Halobacteriovorax marinus TaxID=97084 RepID=UPI000BC2D250|nr:hypothetical protein [Halobacteriovorax marinus]ATH08175.1 hypothetical protein BIY24_09505 [Halobacteriovorax marinus]